MDEVGILIVDDDIVSQRALKNILDSEGWHVRIVPVASDAMAELAAGGWSLVIVNVELLELRGPVFATLKELAQANLLASDGPEDTQPPQKRIRVLFLVSALAREARALLDQEGLTYALKPYHLHEFLEKVSELLVDAGAIAEPIRGNSFSGKKRADTRVLRETGREAMFASRENYQMTEEEIADFEREEETERKKRQQKSGDRR